MTAEECDRRAKVYCCLAWDLVFISLVVVPLQLPVEFALETVESLLRPRQLKQKEALAQRHEVASGSDQCVVCPSRF